MIQRVEEWTPSINETVVVNTGRGVFASIAGKSGYVASVADERREANVVVNGSSYILSFDDLRPLDAPTVLRGSAPELLTRIARLADQLKDAMREQALVGFGDGARWRADVEDGRLKIWEVKP